MSFHRAGRNLKRRYATHLCTQRMERVARLAGATLRDESRSVLGAMTQTPECERGTLSIRVMPLKCRRNCRGLRAVGGNRHLLLDGGPLK